nr:hypothetical protein CFP56_69699 [Quercus suber]
MDNRTSKRKTYQEGKKDATSEKVLMQKMLESVDAPAKVLKKIIGHLSKIAKEEAKKFKATREQRADLKGHRPHDDRREGSWEDHDWLEWTSKMGTTQVTQARFMLECNIGPSSDDD